MTHSPPPWTWFEHNGRLIVIPDDGEGKHPDGVYGLDICSLPGFAKDSEANAKLIVAAPKLLEALMELHSDIVSLVECIDECEEDGGRSYATTRTRRLLGNAFEAIKEATP